jgi:hypothetical protein
MSQSRETGTIICMLKQLHTHTQACMQAHTQHSTTGSAYVYVCALILINSSIVYILNNNKQVTILIQVLTIRL